MRRGAWTILALVIACACLATVVSGDNSVTLDNYQIGDTHGDLLLELDFTEGSSVVVSIDVSASRAIDIYFIHSKELARAVEGTDFMYFTFYTRENTMSYRDYFTLRAGTFDHASYYFYIRPYSTWTSYLDVVFTAEVDYDGDEWTGDMDAYPYIDDDMVDDIFDSLMDIEDDLCATADTINVTVDEMGVEVDGILDSLDDIQHSLNLIESNVSQLRSDLNTKTGQLRSDLTEVDNRDFNSNVMQTNTAQENLDKALSEAERARNTSIALGAGGIVLALLALVVAIIGGRRGAAPAPVAPAPQPPEMTEVLASLEEPPRAVEPTPPAAPIQTIVMPSTVGMPEEEAPAPEVAPEEPEPPVAPEETPAPEAGPEELEPLELPDEPPAPEPEGEVAEAQDEEAPVPEPEREETEGPEEEAPAAEPEHEEVEDTEEEPPAPPKTRFCNKCGNELVEGAKFCNRCGKPL